MTASRLRGTDPALHGALAQRLADWCREMSIDDGVVNEQMLRFFYADQFFHEDLLCYLADEVEKRKGT